MLRRVLGLLIVVTIADGLEVSVLPTQRNSRIVLAPDKEDVVKTAGDRVRKWSTMGMWLPEKDVPFFQLNFSEVEKVLEDALADPNDEIRQRAAYVVERLGPTASPLEPVLIQRIETEPSRIVRMYLFAAARSLEAKSDRMLAVLTTRFFELEKEPEVRKRPHDYKAIDERITVASAFLNLDNVPMP